MQIKFFDDVKFGNNRLINLLKICRQTLTLSGGVISNSKFTNLSLEVMRLLPDSSAERVFISKTRFYGILHVFSMSSTLLFKLLSRFIQVANIKNSLNLASTLHKQYLNAHRNHLSDLRSYHQKWSFTWFCILNVNLRSLWICGFRANFISN